MPLHSLVSLGAAFLLFLSVSHRAGLYLALKVPLWVTTPVAYTRRVALKHLRVLLRVF